MPAQVDTADVPQTGKMSLPRWKKRYKITKKNPGTLFPAVVRGVRNLQNGVNSKLNRLFFISFFCRVVTVSGPRGAAQLLSFSPPLIGPDSVFVT